MTTFKQREAALKACANLLEDELIAKLGRRTNFVLIIATDDRCNHITNTPRDMVATYLTAVRDGLMQ